MSEEVAQSAADLATVQQLRQEIATAQTVIEGLQRVLAQVKAECAQMQTERDYWRAQAQDALAELHAVEAARNATEAELREQLRVVDAEIAAYAERAEAVQQEFDAYRAYWEQVNRRAGDEHTRQGGEAATIRQLAIDLLNQLTVLRMPDESALWLHGGLGLERAYQTLKKGLEGTL